MKGIQLLVAVLLLLNVTAQAQSLDTTRLIQFFSILEPDGLSQIIPQSDGVFGNATFGDDLKNNVIMAEAAFPTVDQLFCTDDGTDFTGKIAIISRGSCEFSVKALNAQNKGAIAVIIINISNSVINMASGSVGTQVTIPVIMIPTSIGNALFAAHNNGDNITLSLGQAPAGFKLIEGHIRQDENNNCTVESSELPAMSWRVAVTNNQGNTNVRSTDINGRYRAYMPPTGAPYTVTAIPPSSAWKFCTNQINVPASAADTVQVNFATQDLYDCTQLETEISSSIMRRCFDVVFYVQVCNTGTVTAEDAYVEVTLPAEMEPVSAASLPFTVLANDVYRFDLGDLAPLECINLQLTALNDCDSTILEQTLCYSAQAYPDTSCVQPSTSWNGANIQVTANCNGTEVLFTIKNVGTAPMSSAADYIVIQDHVMYMTVPFTLDAGQSITVPVPANGSTWRLEATQVPNHPIPGNPSKTIEGCTTSSSFSTGYALMYPLYDLGNAYDEECKEVIGSYDPNDKQGYPLGFGDKKLIRPNVPIDYLIRFQNTGTDTAFTVVVRDTLPPSLDPMSIRGLQASHPYKFEILNNNKLSFRFDNIKLVDSFTNLLGSQGFISFRINQKADNPFGTNIDNSAGIYFDFNPPVITNISHHEVGEVVGLVPVLDLPGNIIPMAVFPNPASTASTLRLMGNDFDQSNWQMIDMNGKILMNGTVKDNMVLLRDQKVVTGVYYLQITKPDGLRYISKVIMK
jgi:uncharacterized repeat protein (TIGR01451 family)